MYGTVRTVVRAEGRGNPPSDPISRNDDRFYTVVAGDRVDLLAVSYLGQADLRWVLLD